MKFFQNKDAENKKNYINLNLNFFSSFLVIVTIIIFFLIIFISYTVNASHKALKQSLSRFLICENTSKIIRTTTSELTELARLFVINKDERFALSYLDAIENSHSQEQALIELKDVFPDKNLMIERLNIAISQAKSLSLMELYDIRLCYEILDKNIEDIPEKIREIQIKQSDKNLSKEELQELAIKNIFGNGYLIYKMRVLENCNLTVDSIARDIKKEVDENSEKLSQNLDRLRILILVLLIINALSTIGLKEFKNLTRSYNKIYEIGEKKTKNLLKNAEYDALTELLNRRAYEQICSTSAEQKISMALLLIDMDNFKSINDTYGHAGGDEALKSLASILKDTFRNGDYIARIGGDEFAAILTDFKISGLKIVTEKIKYINERLSELKDLKNISISVGMAFSSTGYSEELYKKADKALYAVKAAGKKGCRIYDSSLQ